MKHKASISLRVGQALAVLLMSAFGQINAAEPTAPISVPTIANAPALTMVINKSTILRLDAPAARISVANPAVADITPISSREIYVLAKAVGNTNLIVWSKAGSAIMMDVKVTPEPVQAAPVPVEAERESVEVIKGLNKSQMEF